jgi:hypothetical protein
MSTLANLGTFLVGVGVLLIGTALVWGVSVWQKKNQD